MREELEKKLVEDFPELFSDHGGDPMETCMAWGCACGDGWEPTIRNLCQTLKGYGDTNLRLKTLLPAFQKQKVWFHNLCRKIENKLGLKYASLYCVTYGKFQNFKAFRVKFSQIKEKFGTLRIYTEVYNVHTPEEAAKFSKKDIEDYHKRFRGYVDGAVSFAECMSGNTCEYCGEAGQLSTKGWWKTLCPSCADKRNKL
jgi:hypothetical protein